MHFCILLLLCVLVSCFAIIVGHIYMQIAIILLYQVFEFDALLHKVRAWV